MVIQRLARVLLLGLAGFLPLTMLYLAGARRKNRR